MDIRKLSKEYALKLHNEMWSDMKEDLGDNPSAVAREDFKSEWCDKKFPDYIVAYNCFLCEYGEQQSRKKFGGPANRCQFCPIDWNALIAVSDADKTPTCFRQYKGIANTYIYDDAPISDILALSERE